MMARGDDPTVLSYIAAAVSGVLLACLVGYLAYDAFHATDPPRIVVAVSEDEVRLVDGHAYVPVDIVNEGDESATQIVIEVSGEGAVEGLETVVDYLAGGESHRVVALVANGAPGSFRARIVSYQEP
jgi:uncharacterized protein (TIGR02588 family)